MKNQFIKNFISVIKINIQGKNIERFIKRLYTNKIEILEIKYLNYNNVNIKIYKKDFKKVLKLKTTYEIKTINTYGFIKIKKVLEKNKILIIAIIFGIILLYVLSNFIFSIEIVHTDKNLRKLINNELDEYGIKTYHFQKSYEEIQQIKKRIIEEHKDKIEWLEIEKVGTKYIVRLEERKINDSKKSTKVRNIVASKSAIITNVIASKGEIVKQKNTYVKKGDVVISGEIYLNEELKDKVRAEGEVYGEVWYQVTVDYPYTYYEEKQTGKMKDVYVLKFLNKDFELFNFNKYKNKIKQDNNLLSHPILPIRLVKQTQREIEIIDKKYTKKEAIIKAEELAQKRLLSKLNVKDEIISQKTLKVIEKNSKIEVVVFFTVNENITAYAKIKDQKKEQESR